MRANFDCGVQRHKRESIRFPNHRMHPTASVESLWAVLGGASNTAITHRIMGAQGMQTRVISFSYVREHTLRMADATVARVRRIVLQHTVGDPKKSLVCNGTNGIGTRPRVTL